MQRTLSAPGKLFVAGEYAVLWGGAAWVAAVGPRSRAWVQRRDDREVHLVLPELRLWGQATAWGARWAQAPPPELQVVARVVDEVLRLAGRQVLGFELTLEPGLPSPDGRKLGMGGSARAAVLAAEAVRYVLELSADALKLALLGHARAQGMGGSGADVAACFVGGCIRYRRFDVAALAAASDAGRLSAVLAAAPAVDALRFSTGLPLAYAYSGHSAHTPTLIAQVEARLDKATRAKFVQRSDALGYRLEDALLREDFPRVQEVVPQLQALLGELGAPQPEATSRLIALCASVGSVAKSSGAGGGDGCLVISPSPPARAEALAALTARGFHAFPVALEPGLRGEAQNM
jgi:phosphomevalonate kinase